MRNTSDEPEPRKDWTLEEDLFAETHRRLEESLERERLLKSRVAELEGVLDDWLSDVLSFTTRLEQQWRSQNREAEVDECARRGEPPASKMSSGEVLEKYVGGPLHQGRRREIAVERFERLVATGSTEDMVAAALDPECPEEVILTICMNGDLPWGDPKLHELMRALASNPNTPADQLRLLFEDPVVNDLRSMIANNPSCPNDLKEMYDELAD